MKKRLDKLLVERGLTPSRERAQALILAGKVLVNEQKIEKAGAAVDVDSALRLLGVDLRYVSRGGLKLERAIAYWKIEVAGKTCLDVGASTGGFTDCMLQHGARRVIAIDTGHGQMDFRLRSDPRVRLLEKKNARYLTTADLRAGARDHDVADSDGGGDVEFIAMDVSFISATQVLPALIGAAFAEIATSPDREETGSTALTEPAVRPIAARPIVVLVKPQFEVGRELVGKGGIVRDESAQRAAVVKVETTLRELGCRRTEWIESPILGAEGNREFLLYGEFPLSDGE